MEQRTVVVVVRHTGVVVVDLVVVVVDKAKALVHSLVEEVR
jgi:hypothetical protein